MTIILNHSNSGNHLPVCSGRENVLSESILATLILLGPAEWILLDERVLEYIQEQMARCRRQDAIGTIHYDIWDAGELLARAIIRSLFFQEGTRALQAFEKILEEGQPWTS